LSACTPGGELGPNGDDGDDTVESDSHSKGAPADYDRIFSDSKVHRMDIIFDPSVYQEMEDEMTDFYGEFGDDSGGPGGPGGPGDPGDPGNPGDPNPPSQEALDACIGMQQGDHCSYEEQGATVSGICELPPHPDAEMFCMGPPPGGEHGPGPGEMEEPSYFEVTVEYEGDTWEHVGMRYKGNSSLNSTWRSGNHKIPFRLDFDEYEKEYPETDDQRFWGFKKLTFSSNFRDDSFLREKICGDIFRDAGIPTAESAFYRIFVDAGDGPVYWGLYTMVEDPSNKMLDTQFDDDDGNLYKPEGPGADWTYFSEGGFEKKTNEDEADWSDVENAINALHDRGQSSEDWRAGLETYLDVDIFLRWLAIHTMQQNWDAYGRSPHNYYLYGDPSDNGRLVWIPWDLNEAMTDETSNSHPLEIDLEDVGDEAPLIRYLMDDEVYANTYREELQAAMDGAYELTALHETMERYHDMIEPYVIGEEGEIDGHGTLRSESDFTQSLRGGPDALIDLSESRHDVVNAYLSGF